MPDRIVTYQAADGPVRTLFVMAAEAEYGPALRALIRPVITGVGPVESAAATARALAVLAAGGDPVDLVVSLGSCGSRTFAQGTIVQVASVGYRDMDASPLGFDKGVTPFLGLPAVLAIPQRLPGLPAARLSTGAGIVSGAAYDTIEAEIVDMETFGVLRAADLAGAAMIGLRGVSDGASELTCYADWADYLHAVDERLAAVIATLPGAIAARPVEYWRRRAG